MALQLREKTIDRLGRHDGVAVEQEHVLAHARANTHVVAARKAKVGARLDDPYVSPMPCRRGTPIDRRIVDHDDLVRACGRAAVQRLQAALEIRTRVERDDDDRKVEHRESSVFSPRSAVAAPSRRVQLIDPSRVSDDCRPVAGDRDRIPERGDWRPKSR